MSTHSQSFSVFTSVVADNVVQLMKTDRLAAYDYYIKALDMPVVVDEQLDRTILTMTDVTNTGATNV